MKILWVELRVNSNYCLTLQHDFMIKLKMNQKSREKGADLLLDIVKYVITAGLLATMFSKTEGWEWYWYVTIVGIIIVTTWWGLSIYKDDDKKKRR